MQQNRLERETYLNKRSSWLTKNRFWNLIFLFFVPFGIYLAAVVWSWYMLLLPLALTIAVFGFVPTDEGTITPEQARKDPFARAACAIWLINIIAFCFAGSKILSLFGLELGQFAFGEVIFFIFLIPICILCYANIPLSSCIEYAKYDELPPSILSTGDPRVSLGTRMHNQNNQHRRKKLF